MGDQFTFWGTSDSAGVPRVYCDCKVCTEARSGGVNRRWRSSGALETDTEGILLIDCGPDWQLQMERFEVRRTNKLLVTHAHYDHIGGIPMWADSFRGTDEIGQLYAPEEVTRSVRRCFPWLEGRIDYRTVDAGLSFGGWSIVPWKVQHGHNGFSYAYIGTKGTYRWVYCTDAIHLSAEEKAPFADADLLILGTSYYREAEQPRRSVYDMIEGVELAAEIRAKRTVFTHMSHDIDLRRNYELPSGIRLAETGMRVKLANG